MLYPETERNHQIGYANERVGQGLSIINQVKSEIVRLEKQLAEKKELVTLLEEEPKIQRVLDLMVGNRF